MRGLELLAAAPERRVGSNRKVPAPSTARMSATERAGEAAVRRGDWKAARILFLQAAEEAPANPHGGATADVKQLVRRALVAHSMYQRLQVFGLERAFVKAA